LTIAIRLAAVADCDRLARWWPPFATISSRASRASPCSRVPYDVSSPIRTRGRRVGARLLDASIGRARTRGCRVLGLDTNERNEDALRLYRRAGFTAERSRWGGGRQLWLEVVP
jgi:hypothetical protein